MGVAGSSLLMEPLRLVKPAALGAHTQGLSARGKLQARGLGRYLSLTEFQHTEIISSILQRSKETADIICTHIKPNFSVEKND